jgi:hypothetical protein
VTGSANVATLSVDSFNVGGKLSYELKPVTLTLQGTGFIAQNAAPLVANFAMFRIGSEGKPNVNSRGYWLQAGVAVDKFSVWGLYGLQKIAEDDVARAVAGANQAYENGTTNVIAMYRDGGFGFSLEWIGFKTKLATSNNGVDSITGHITSKADQYMATANYFF